MQSSSFFRLQALLHLCRLLLRPFITLFSTESASHFNCIAPFYSSLHLSFCLHPPIMHLSILVCLSLLLFSVVSCHTSSSSDTADIASFLFSACLHHSFHLSESLSTSIPLYLLLHSCPCEIIYSSTSFFSPSCISLSTFPSPLPHVFIYPDLLLHIIFYCDLQVIYMHPHIFSFHCASLCTCTHTC